MDGHARSRGGPIEGRIDGVCVAIGALAFGYVAVRAATLSFVHDESLSYLHYAFPGVPLSDVLRFEGFAASNNHLLNTLGMRASALVFGSGELALRLPNVLAAIPWLLAVFALTRRFGCATARLGAFAAAAANPFVLDFQGLARGYGLALAASAVALLFLVRSGEDEDPARHAAAAVACSALAVLAQFTFLVFHLATLLVVALFALRRVGESASGTRAGALASQLAAPAAIGGAALLVAVPSLLKLRAIGELYVGGTQGFFADTVRSLLRSSFYETGVHAPIETAVGLACALLVGVGAASLLASRRAPRPSAIGVVPIALLLAMAAGCIALHHLLGVQYPEDRGALMFWLPLVLAIGFAADELARRGPRLRLAGHAAGGLLLLGTAASVAHGANLTHTLLWAYDADTREAVRAVTEAEARVAQGVMPADGARRIGVSWRFEPSVNFYILHFELRWLAFAHRGGVQAEPFDYYFFEPEDGAALAGTPLATLRTFPRSGNVLAVRRAQEP